MINLNLLEVTYDNVLKLVSDYDIFNYYMPEFEIGSSFSSPLRKDDTPSFTVFQSKKDNTLLYHDFATGESGDCFKFVSKLFHTDRNGSFKQVILDFGLEEHFFDIDTSIASREEKKRLITGLKPKEKVFKKIRITVKGWDLYDIEFWAKFGIGFPTLKKFNVYTIQNVFVNEYVFPCRKYSYAFIEGKDDTITYKIYQPYSHKFKWLSNHPNGVHQGYKQLPGSGELLIITKSLKDVMSLHDVANIPAIGVQCETSFIKPSVMEEYKRRFDRVVVLFDNDATGIEFAKKYSEKYNTPHIILPNLHTKDFSDLVARVGKQEAIKQLNTLLK